MVDEVVGTDSNSYTPVTADVGADLYCKVTATNAIGSASADSNTVGPVAAAGGGDEAETTAWAAAVVTAGGTVSAGRKTLVNTLIAGLKTDGVWALLDRLWILAGENSQSALRDIKTIGVATAVAAPTFTIDRGYAGDGATSFILTDYDPTTDATSYSLNSASIFAYNRTSGSASEGIMGSGSGGHGDILPVLGGNGYIRLHFAAGATLPGNSLTDGLWISSRTSSTVHKIYRNGSELVTADATPATTIPNENYGICAINSGGWYLGSTHQIACAGTGGGLDATQAAALTTRIETYMDAIGAGVI